MKSNEADLLELKKSRKGESPVDQKELARNEMKELFARRGEITFLAEEIPRIDARVAELRKFINGVPT